MGSIEPSDRTENKVVFPNLLGPFVDSTRHNGCRCLAPPWLPLQVDTGIVQSTVDSTPLGAKLELRIEPSTLDRPTLDQERLAEKVLVRVSPIIRGAHGIDMAAGLARDLPSIGWLWKLEKHCRGDHIDMVVSGPSAKHPVHVN